MDQSARRARQLTGVLAVFGAKSLAGGSLLAASGKDRTVAAFGQQTAMWGAINLGIAGYGWWRSRSKPMDAGRLRTILLINAGLDLAYITAGAVVALTADPDDPNLQARRGHGAAIVVQGVTLFVLDTAFAALLTHDARTLAQ